MAKKKAKKQIKPDLVATMIRWRQDLDELHELVDGDFLVLARALKQHQDALQAVSQLADIDGVMFARLEKKIDSIQSGVVDLLIDWIARVALLEAKLATLFPATFKVQQSDSFPDLPRTATAAAARSESEQGEPETNVYRDGFSIVDLGCRVPPKGWLCTRQVGHQGPCAAIPVTVTDPAEQTNG
jgi:hypothetical protein